MQQNRQPLISLFFFSEKVRAKTLALVKHSLLETVIHILKAFEELIP